MTMKNASELLEEAKRTCYSCGMPDYARIGSLLRQYGELLKAIPGTLGSVDYLLDGLSDQPSGVRNQGLETAMVALDGLYENVKAMKQRLKTEAESRLIQSNQAIERLLSYPGAPAAELGSLQESVHDWVERNMSGFPSDADLDAERALLQMYVEAAKLSE